MVKEKEAVTAESLPRSLREICLYYITLVDEKERAESPKYTVQAYESGYHFSLAAMQLE